MDDNLRDIIIALIGLGSTLGLAYIAYLKSKR